MRLLFKKMSYFFQKSHMHVWIWNFPLIIHVNWIKFEVVVWNAIFLHKSKSQKKNTYHLELNINAFAEKRDCNNE